MATSTSRRASTGTPLQQAAAVVAAVFLLVGGVAGLAMARTWGGARWYLLGGGAVYGVLFVYGTVVDHHGDANFVPVNRADNWLHLALAVGMLAFGALLGKSANAHSSA